MPVLVAALLAWSIVRLYYHHVWLYHQFWLLEHLKRPSTWNIWLWKIVCVSYHVGWEVMLGCTIDEHWWLPDDHWRFKGWQGCWEGLFCRLGRLAGLASRMGWWALWASWPVTVGWRADEEFWFWIGKMQVDLDYKYHHSVFAFWKVQVDVGV